VSVCGMYESMFYSWEWRHNKLYTQHHANNLTIHQSHSKMRQFTLLNADYIVYHVTKSLPKIPPHTECVATVPCKICGIFWLTVNNGLVFEFTLCRVNGTTRNVCFLPCNPHTWLCRSEHRTTCRHTLCTESPQCVLQIATKYHNSQHNARPSTGLSAG